MADEDKTKSVAENLETEKPLGVDESAGSIENKEDPAKSPVGLTKGHSLIVKSTDSKNNVSLVIKPLDANTDSEGLGSDDNTENSSSRPVGDHKVDEEILQNIPGDLASLPVDLETEKMDLSLPSLPQDLADMIPGLDALSNNTAAKQSNSQKDEAEILKIKNNLFSVDKPTFGGFNSHLPVSQPAQLGLHNLPVRPALPASTAGPSPGVWDQFDKEVRQLAETGGDLTSQGIKVLKPGELNGKLPASQPGSQPSLQSLPHPIPQAGLQRQSGSLSVPLPGSQASLAGLRPGLPSQSAPLGPPTQQIVVQMAGGAGSSPSKLLLRPPGALLAQPGAPAQPGIRLLSSPAPPHSQAGVYTMLSRPGGPGGVVGTSMVRLTSPATGPVTAMAGGPGVRLLGPGMSSLSSPSQQLSSPRLPGTMVSSPSPRFMGSLLSPGQLTASPTIPPSANVPLAAAVNALAGPPGAISVAGTAGVGIRLPGPPGVRPGPPGARLPGPASVRLTSPVRAASPGQPGVRPAGRGRGGPRLRGQVRPTGSPRPRLPVRPGGPRGVRPGAPRPVMMRGARPGGPRPRAPLRGGPAARLGTPPRPAAPPPPAAPAGPPGLNTYGLNTCPKPKPLKVEVVDLSDDDEPAPPRSATLDKLQACGISVSRQKAPQVPSNVRLPPGISINGVTTGSSSPAPRRRPAPAEPSGYSPAKRVAVDPNVASALSAGNISNDSGPKKKVELELSDKQMDALKALGLL